MNMVFRPGSLRSLESSGPSSLRSPPLAASSPPADEVPFAEASISPAELDKLIGRRWAGLTRLQLAVLYIIGFHVDDDGVFRIPAHRIGILVGRGKGSDSRCAAIPIELCEFGLLHEGPRRAGGIRTWRLSRLGHAVFRELIGEKGC